MSKHIDYEYNGKQYLNTTTNFIWNEKTANNICICSYVVDTSGKFPFLKFILERSNEGLIFPSINLSMDSNYTVKNIIEKATNMMRKKIQDNEHNKISNNVIVDGFYRHKNNYYLFLDFTNTDLFLNDINFYGNLFFTLMDEIINIKKVFHLNINENVSDFFLENKHFCFLVDRNNENYETPTAVYLCEKKNFLQFQCTFGIQTKDNRAILGPYYYFTTYENAIKHILRIVDENEVVYGSKITLTDKHFGLLRFAIFLGKTNIIYASKTHDNSLIKTHKITENSIHNSKSMEVLTLHISDHDGNWTKYYDSCFLGNITLENGVILQNSPLYVIKEYDRHVPLNYVFL